MCIHIYVSWLNCVFLYHWIMDIHRESYPIMDTHHWIIDIHNWTSCVVEIPRVYLSWIILWWYRHILSVLQGFFNLTNCKCSPRCDLLNRADIFQNDNEKTACDAAHIIWNWYVLNILTQFGVTTGATVLGRPFCARRMGPSRFHALSDGNPSWSFSVHGVISQ